MASSFFKEVKAWSQIKHQILGNYLSLFLGKTGIRGRVFYVDAFAGCGRYEEDGSDGSPLIAARLALDPPAKSRARVLHCINVEKIPENFANLERWTEQFVKERLVTNLEGEFETHLDNILQTVKGETALFFLDPFGVDGVGLPTLNRLFNRGNEVITEAFLRYDHNRIKRFIGWAANNIDSNNPTSRKIADTLGLKASQFTDDSAVSAVLANNPGRNESVLEGYLNLVKERIGVRFGLKYPIKNPETRAIRYYLVHFCNFEDGYIHMANFMAKADRSVQRLASKAVQPGLFDSPDSTPQQGMLLPILKEADRATEESNVTMIIESLPETLREAELTGNVQNRQIYAAIVDRWGPRFLRSEWIKAMRSLEKQKVFAMNGSNDNNWTNVHL